MTYRTGNHGGRTIILEGVEPADKSGRRPDDRLVATVDSAAPEGLAERICALLNFQEHATEIWGPDDGNVLDQCQEETWSLRHFNTEQADGYWIRCSLQGPHAEHKDSHTGLTWVGEDT